MRTYSFQRIICPICSQPIYPIIRQPGDRVLYKCACPGATRDPGGEDRDIKSGALGLGPVETDEEPDDQQGG